MTPAARALALAAAALLLSGCRTTEIFEVEAPGALSATVTLNGRATKLKKSGDVLSGVRKIFRVNAGEIVVSYPDGATVTCEVQYLTPGVQEYLRYRIEDGRCLGPLDD